MGVLQEQKAESYLRGQVWNREEKKKVGKVLLVKTIANFGYGGFFPYHATFTETNPQSNVGVEFYSSVQPFAYYAVLPAGSSPAPPQNLLYPTVALPYEKQPNQFFRRLPLFQSIFYNPGTTGLSGDRGVVFHQFEIDRLSEYAQETGYRYLQLLGSKWVGQYESSIGALNSYDLDRSFGTTSAQIISDPILTGNSYTYNSPTLYEIYEQPQQVLGHIDLEWIVRTRFEPIPPATFNAYYDWNFSFCFQIDLANPRASRFLPPVPEIPLNYVFQTLTTSSTRPQQVKY